MITRQTMFFRHFIASPIYKAHRTCRIWLGSYRWTLHMSCNLSSVMISWSNVELFQLNFPFPRKWDHFCLRFIFNSQVCELSSPRGCFHSLLWKLFFNSIKNLLPFLFGRFTCLQQSISQVKLRPVMAGRWSLKQNSFLGWIITARNVVELSFCLMSISLFSPDTIPIVF